MLILAITHAVKKSLKINEILHITLAREEMYVFFLLVLYFNILPLI